MSAAGACADGGDTVVGFVAGAGAAAGVATAPVAVAGVPGSPDFVQAAASSAGMRIAKALRIMCLSLQPPRDRESQALYPAPAEVDKRGAGWYQPRPLGRVIGRRAHPQHRD